MSLSVSSRPISSSLDAADRKSSSESISLVVTGVGGAGSEAAEATILFLGPGSVGVEVDVIFASAAFRFPLVGAIVTAFIPKFQRGGCCVVRMQGALIL